MKETIIESKVYDVVGIKYCDIWACCLRKDDSVDLYFEEDNEFDENAISLWWRDREGDLQRFGYLPRGVAKKVRDSVAEGLHVNAWVDYVKDDGRDSVVRVRLDFSEREDDIKWDGQGLYF